MIITKLIKKKKKFHYLNIHTDTNIDMIFLLFPLDLIKRIMSEVNRK